MQLALEMGLFRRKDTAGRRIRRLQKKPRRYIRCIGRYEITRNQNLHFLFAAIDAEIKADNLDHEIGVSRLMAKYYPYCEWLTRLYDVDPSLRPDATFRMADATFHLEFYNTESQTRSQISGHMRRYEGTNEAVLIVCRTAKRMKAVREAIPESVRPLCAFAIFEEVLKSPFGKVWWSYDGEAFAVPKGVLHPAHKYVS